MTLQSEIIKLAKQARDHANALDKNWLKDADPRAVEGGDVCEEAQHYREINRRLLALAAFVEG